MPLYTPNNVLDDTISQMTLKAHSLSGWDVTNKKIKQILVHTQKKKRYYEIFLYCFGEYEHVKCYFKQTD